MKILSKKRLVKKAGFFRKQLNLPHIAHVHALVLVVHVISALHVLYIVVISTATSPDIYVQVRYDFMLHRNTIHRVMQY